MTGIDVHGDVGQVQLLESIGDTVAVAGSGVLAGLEVGVGDQVGERIGLDDESDGSVGVLLEDGDNGWLDVSMIFQVFMNHSNSRSMYSDL